MYGYYYYWSVIIIIIIIIILIHLFFPSFLYVGYYLPVVALFV